MIITDSEQGLVVSNDDQAVKLLRAAIRGDQDDGVGRLEALDNVDVVRLIATLRACAGERGCLDLDTIRGAPDLIMHVAKHSDRLSDWAVRAFVALGCGGHAADRSPHPARLADGADVTVRFVRGVDVQQVDGWVEEVTDVGLTLDLGPGRPFKVEAITIPWASISEVIHYEVPRNGRQAQARRRKARQRVKSN